MTEQEMEIIQCVIGAVVFQNYENGYAVLRLDEGFIVFLRLNERWETPRKVINGIISWDNMRIIYVSLEQRVFITRITLLRYRKNCTTR